MLGVYNSDLIMRLKPWEAYKAQENESKGLLAALDQEDVDRVSSIYFTQVLKEDLEEEAAEDQALVTLKNSESNADSFNMSPVKG